MFFTAFLDSCYYFVLFIHGLKSQNFCSFYTCFLFVNVSFYCGYFIVGLSFEPSSLYNRSWWVVRKIVCLWNTLKTRVNWWVKIVIGVDEFKTLLKYNILYLIISAFSLLYCNCYYLVLKSALKFVHTFSIKRKHWRKPTEPKHFIYCEIRLS